MSSEQYKSFMKAKDQVIDNLETLQVLLDDYTEEGLLDPESVIYNELLAILDEADLSEGNPELAEVIVRGKELEHNLDTWLSMHGGNSMELTWPKLE